MTVSNPDDKYYHVKPSEIKTLVEALSTLLFIPEDNDLPELSWRDEEMETFRKAREIINRMENQP